MRKRRNEETPAQGCAEESLFLALTALAVFGLFAGEIVRFIA